jgi:hypothetical protein
MASESESSKLLEEFNKLSETCKKQAENVQADYEEYHMKVSREMAQFGREMVEFNEKLEKIANNSWRPTSSPSMLSIETAAEDEESEEEQDATKRMNGFHSYKNRRLSVTKGHRDVRRRILLVNMHRQNFAVDPQLLNEYDICQE